MQRMVRHAVQAPRQHWQVDSGLLRRDAQCTVITLRIVNWWC